MALPQDVAPDEFLALSDEAARLLRAMGHGPRLRILCLLIDGGLCSGDIARTLGMREAAASQQLGLLRAERLIEARREGQRVHYMIARPVVAELVEALRRHLCVAEPA